MSAIGKYLPSRELIYTYASEKSGKYDTLYSNYREAVNNKNKELNTLLKTETDDEIESIEWTLNEYLKIFKNGKNEVSGEIDQKAVVEKIAEVVKNEMGDKIIQDKIIEETDKGVQNMIGGQGYWAAKNMPEGSIYIDRAHAKDLNLKNPGEKEESFIKRFNTMINKVNEAMKHINSSTRHKKSGIVDINELKKVKNEWWELEQVLKNEEGKINSYSTADLKFILNNENGKSILDRVNRMVEMIRVSSYAPQYVGIFGEAITEAAVSAALVRLGKEFEEFKSSIVGGERSERTIDLDLLGIDEMIAKEVFKGKVEQIGDTKCVITAQGVQDKRDVELEMSIIGGGSKKLGFSVKNYTSNNLDSGVTFVTGTPLLTLLQLENEMNFVNHYLALSFMYKDGSLKNRESMRGEISDIVKKIVIMKAISGNKILSSISDKGEYQYAMDTQYLVLINSTDGKAIVRPIGAIVEHVLAAEDHLSKINLGNTAPWTADEIYRKDEIYRHTEMLKYLQNTKITYHASMKGLFGK